MADRAPRRIRFNRPVHLVMRGGIVLEALPGNGPGEFHVRVVVPVGKPAGAAGGTGARRGRPVAAATLKLRERLAADREAGTLGTTQHYVDMYRKAGAKASPGSAVQQVRREMRAILGPRRRGRPAKAAAKPKGARKGKAGRRARTPGAGGQRGRPAGRETLVLRTRLEADKAKGASHDVGHYTRWLVDQVSGLGLKRARALVYRERRRMGA